MKCAMFLFFLIFFFTLQVILTQLPGQDLHVEVFDKDMDMKDDFLGRYNNSYKHSFIKKIKCVDLKMHSNLPYPDIQAEDQSEGHHRFSVH